MKNISNLASRFPFKSETMNTTIYIYIFFNDASSSVIFFLHAVILQNNSGATSGKTVLLHSCALQNKRKTTWREQIDQSLTETPLEFGGHMK